MGLAVVTGGTRGIGRGIAKRLAEGGHEVVAIGSSANAEPIDDVEITTCDITSEEAVSELFARLGPVEILVNNAGVSSSNPLHRTSLAEWERHFAVNTTGPFLCSREVVKPMMEAGSGHIITVASITSVEGAKYISAYAASKHAVLGLMRVIAAEVDQTGVSVGTVMPTYVRTDMTAQTIANIAERLDVNLVEAEKRLAADATPHGRIIEVDEVVDSVMALIDSNLNGQEILLDGGSS